MTLAERLKKFDLLPEISEDEHKVLSPELRLVFARLSKELSDKISSIPVWFEYSIEEQKQLVLDFLNVKLNDECFSEAEKDSLKAVFLECVFGFGALDFLIAREEVSTIILNSCDEILIEVGSEVVKSDVLIDKRQFNSLVEYLKKISNKSGAVIAFRHKNLFITIISEPVGVQKLILKKIDDINYNFSFFEDKQILNIDIAEFFKSLLESGKRFLVSAPAGAGKTAFLSAFINETSSDKKSYLFENGALINSTNTSLERFDIETLSQIEQTRLVKGLALTKPDYVFSDTNDIGFNIELADNFERKVGMAMTVCAESPLDALTFFTSVQAARLKCTEQYAKVKFSSYFDYLIQLEKRESDFVVKTILEVSNNTSGTPVLTEKLAFDGGAYKYDFPVNPVIVPPKDADPLEIPRKKLTFKSRFDG